jgi:hypothetical protein
MDRWQSKTVVCKGGLILSEEVLTQGTTQPGSARILQNYEPSIEGGYERILGYSKYTASTVTGTGPILGTKVALGGVFAVRYDGVSDNALYFSSGSSWSAALNGTARTGAVTKARMISYNLASTPKIALVDGYNYAAKYDGTTYTRLNGLGAPTDPRYVAFHLDRLVLAGYTANPRAITLSAPSSDTVYSGSGAIELVVGDIVTGLATFRNTLYIFCQKSIAKLVGSSSTDFAIEFVTRSLGCIAADSIQEVGGDLVFLAPDGVRSVAATERIGDVSLGLISNPIRSVVRDFQTVVPEYYYSSCPIREKSQYRLFIYGGTGVPDSDVTSLLGKFTNLDTGNGTYEWGKIVGINAYCADSSYTALDQTAELAVFGHPSNGYVYKMEYGNSFDGSNISYIYQSPQMTFDDASIRKVLETIRIYTKVSGSISTTVNIYYDFQNDEQRQPPAFSLSQTGATPEYGTAVYGTDTYGALTFPVFRNDLIGSGFTAAVQFSGSDMNPPHRIDSFQIEYGVAGRR